MSDGNEKPAPMIVVYPRGQLTAIDRARLDDHGIVAIEADDPSAVVTMLPGVPLATGDDLLLSALAGIEASGVRDAYVGFGKELITRIRVRANKEGSKNE